MITGTYNQQYIPLFCLLILWLTFNYWEHKKKASIFFISLLFFSIGIFTYSNLGNLGKAVKKRFEDRSLTTTHFYHPFFGNEIDKVEEVILGNRTSHHIPIIYFGNSSPEELSIVFSGIYSGIGNISYLLKKNNFSIPDISEESFIVIDSRLDLKEYELIKSLFPVENCSLLLDLHGTSKVLHIKV